MDNSNSSQQAQLPSEIRTFLENLIDDAGITSLDENVREEMIKGLYARLDNYFASVIIDNMPPEHLEEFIRMNEEKRPKEEIESFLQEKMPNSQEVFAKAMVDFRDLYLGNKSATQSTSEPAQENNSGNGS